MKTAPKTMDFIRSLDFGLYCFQCIKANTGMDVLKNIPHIHRYILHRQLLQCWDHSL